MTTGSAHRNGIDLPYVVSGDGSGPHLLFAHGLMGTGADMRVMSEPLVDAGWTVITMDQRGHAGATPVTDPALYDWHEMGADLWAVADAAGVDRCWVGGGSMGAATSFAATQVAPERVEGHISLIPALRAEGPHPLSAVFDVLADAARDGGVDAMVTLVEQFVSQATQTTSRTADPVGREEFVAQLSSHDIASLECALRTVPKWQIPGVPSAYKDMTYPVIVVGWDGDPIHPLQTAVDVAAAAGVELIQIDQSETVSDRAFVGKTLVQALSAMSV